MRSPRALFDAIRNDRPARLGLLATLGSCAALWSLMCVWVHRSFEGDFSGPLLISAHFQVPERAQEAGIRPTVPKTMGGRGWDGQFYYHMSNDPFLRRDTAAAMDNAPYRYQRIGVPVVARALAKLGGQKVTPPWLFHFSQILLTSLGFGALVWCLARNGQNPAWAFLWLGTAGVLQSLSHGLNDAPCDALFAISLVALLSRNLGIYAASAVLLVLCREGYAAYCAAVFAGTALGLIRWSDSQHTWRRYFTHLTCVGLPGVAVLGWAWYVAQRCGTPILAGSSMPGWEGLTDYPFASMYRNFLMNWHDGLLHEVRMKSVSIAVLVTTLFAIPALARRLPVIVVTLPYVFLITATGDIVWQDQTSYTKAMGSLVVINILLLTVTRGRLIKLLLLANLLFGVQMMFELKVWHEPFFSSRAAALAVEPPPPGPTNPPLTDHSSRVVLREEDDGSNRYEGVWSPFHREAVIVRATVSNLSEQPWLRNPIGGAPLGVSLGWRLLDEVGRPVKEGRAQLPAEVEPGGTLEFSFAVPPVARGTYTLRCAVVQDAVHWLDHPNRANGGELIVTFR